MFCFLYYEIQKKLGDGAFFETITTLNHPTAQYIDNQVYPGNAIYYRVRAVDNVANASDWSVIATANNKPQLKALTGGIEESLEKEGARAYRVGGSPESEWVVVDYFDAVIHLFTANTREYYALEQLWGDAKRVE